MADDFISKILEDKKYTFSNDFSPSLDNGKSYKGGPRIDGLKKFPILIKALDFMNSLDFIQNAEIGKEYWGTITICYIPQGYYDLGRLLAIEMDAESGLVMAYFKREFPVGFTSNDSSYDQRLIVKDLFEGWGKSVFNSKENASNYAKSCADAFAQDMELQREASNFQQWLFPQERR